MSEVGNAENGMDVAVDGIESLDFDVKSEYKSDPLIPKSTYHGVVNSTKFDPSGPCIVWDICLHDNGGCMNDNETPVDGAHVFYRNWLPKPGDENIPTKSGKSNKRQSKINMLQQFQDGVGIDMSTPSIIAQGLSDQSWIGLEVDIEVDVDEYQGKFRNVVNRMRKSSMY